MRWEFQHNFFDLKSKNQIGSGKSIKKNLAPRELSGTRVVPQVFSFYQPAQVLKQESTSFIFQDATGFHVLARQGAKDPAPKILPEKQYILKFPLNQGASWKQQAEGFILEDTVIDTKGSVQTPAGAFQDCLVVKRLYFAPKNPNTPLQEALFWFAPGVGNVKTIIKHPQENKEIVQELVSFTK
ncbi:MAG: hypothetical protein WAU47_13105 [Desulfobaccales bacterium]